MTIGEGEGLGVRLMQGDRELALGDAFLGASTHVGIGFNGVDGLNILVIGEVEAGTEADFKHGTGGLANDATAKRLHGSHERVAEGGENGMSRQG